MLWFLIIGMIAGWLAGNITKGSGFGLIGDIVVGIIGSFIGGFLFSLTGLSAYGTIGEIIMATIGAIVLLWIVRLIR
ncbi:MAG: Transglycosylase-associated protein [Firmicutes bacterium]|nr:Transglycosylase-associated protein [Bacillota bacterium]